MFNDVCIIGKHKFKLIDGQRRTLKENRICTRTTFYQPTLQTQMKFALKFEQRIEYQSDIPGIVVSSGCVRHISSFTPMKQPLQDSRHLVDSIPSNI